MSKKTPERKEFDKIKRKKDFYNQFGGKEKTKEIHHRRMLSNGGENKDYNFVYLITFWHRLYHKLLGKNEIDEVSFRGKNPSIKKQVDDISDGLIKKTKQNMFIEDVIKEMKSKEK